ncbi:MAG: type II toxin-antitoxin system VapC family toxin [Symploca sp. SIO1B1]|nr:type II toxin-antitoxin system VapC family toxin [Symploca sp. SIO1B1]
MLIDSNLIIYATQPPYASLRGWLVEYATHYSAISRLETLGYHRLGEAEKQAIMAVLDNLDMLMIGTVTIELAVALRQQRKISVGDALIAATCLEYQLPLATANEKDFDWIDGLTIRNPIGQDGKDVQDL